MKLIIPPHPPLEKGGGEGFECFFIKAAKGSVREFRNKKGLRKIRNPFAIPLKLTTSILDLFLFLFIKSTPTFHLFLNQLS
jgi:hypothetical protein